MIPGAAATSRPDVIRANLGHSDEPQPDLPINLAGSRHSPTPALARATGGWNLYYLYS